MYCHCRCPTVGLLLPGEQTVIESMKSSENKYFVPCVWAIAIVERAKQEGIIKEEIAAHMINDVRTENVTYLRVGPR